MQTAADMFDDLRRLRPDSPEFWDPDRLKPFHRPHCRCDQCEDWRWDEGLTVLKLDTIKRNSEQWA